MMWQVFLLVNTKSFAPVLPMSTLTSAPARKSLLRPLERGLRVLAFLAEHSASLSDIARATQTPKSSLLDVLNTLVALGHAEHDGKHYRVGPQATTLAARLMGNNSLIHVASSTMEALASATGENVALARFDADLRVLVYTHKVNGTHPIRYDMEVGDQRELYSSNGGRVILAQQNDKWIDAYLRETPLRAHTPNTLVDPADILKRVREVRRRGADYSIEEMSEGGAGFSAPIFNADGHMCSVLVITSVTHRAHRNLDYLLAQVKQAADEISTKLGFVGPSPTNVVTD